MSEQETAMDFYQREIRMEKELLEQDYNALIAFWRKFGV